MLDISYTLIYRFKLIKRYWIEYTREVLEMILIPSIKDEITSQGPEDINIENYIPHYIKYNDFE